MHNDEKIPGELVTQVDVAEVLISCGIQLVHVAHDIAFTDAAFGEAWAVETANRLASLSEVLNILFKRLPQKALEIVIDLPDGMTGVRSINPDFKPPAEKPTSKDVGDSSEEGGSDNSIGKIPF
jgi:hypothetical protein